MEFALVDVFTRRRYAGNQLAVVLGAKGLARGAMQRIAREFNFSETTFVVAEDGRGGGKVRIFTPAREVPFAGHPVLGTAHVLRARAGRNAADAAVLAVPAGPVEVRAEGAAKAPRLWMRQPLPIFGPVADRRGAAAALGLAPGDLRPGWNIQEVSTGLPALVIPVRSRQALDRIRIDSAAHDRLLAQRTAKVLYAFSPGRADGAWKARCFAPFYGVAEDPATGSACGALAAYLAKRGALGGPGGGAVVHQGRHVGRPSTLRIRATLGGAVEVGGSVVDVGKGTLHGP